MVVVPKKQYFTIQSLIVCPSGRSRSGSCWFAGPPNKTVSTFSDLGFPSCEYKQTRPPCEQQSLTSPTILHLNVPLEHIFKFHIRPPSACDIHKQNMTYRTYLQVNHVLTIYCSTWGRNLPYYLRRLHIEVNWMMSISQIMSFQDSIRLRWCGIWN